MSTEKKLEVHFFKERIYPILFMTGITAICILLVSGIFLSTQDLVKLNEAVFLRKAVLYAADIPLPEENEAISALFDERVEEVLDSEGNNLYFRILNENNSVESYVVLIRGPGLWGEMEAAVGISSDFKSYTGIEFTKQNETPGLGARITEEWYKEQYRGKSPPLKLVPEGSAQADNEIDAITGATKTSNLVYDLLNDKFSFIRDLIMSEEEDA